MKKRYEEWYKLTGETKPKAANTILPPIRVLDLPGFQEIEDKLCIYTPTRGALPPEMDAMIDDLSTATFGITANDTLFELPENYSRLPEWSDERIEIEDRYYDHEDQYETAEATDDEAVAILLLRGFDFRDARGQPLRCTLHFSGQAEAAAKGIKGRMPDRAAAGLESWTKKLEQEAKLHLQRKRIG
ncbi:hypothetical protein L598_006200000100 [Mesorhizobium sp. J18]|uniref:hypothetical protein n=1 Tax=Mesorhizobium sp. J18 TaxID=935263 RepID=UPI00119A165E|nr:hypothetical protein [Mesorhizobium sp. J18]TWG90999.1 hypothetical protein L598_006200000100 [Mesorhizobium sp. J18]